MPKFIATPYCMTEHFFRIDAGIGLASNDGQLVGKADDYKARQSIEVDAPHTIAAANTVWRTFQNIDDDWCCPDDGRSMMVGDLIKLEEVDGGTTWLRVAMVGFDKIEAPISG